MDAYDLLPSKASFGDGLGACVISGCCLSVEASLAAVASFGSLYILQCQGPANFLGRGQKC